MSKPSFTTAPSDVRQSFQTAKSEQTRQPPDPRESSRARNQTTQGETLVESGEEVQQKAPSKEKLLEDRRVSGQLIEEKDDVLLDTMDARHQAFSRFEESDPETIANILRGSRTQRFYTLLAGMAYEAEENIPSLINTSSLLQGRVQLMPELAKNNPEFQTFLHQTSGARNEIIISVRGSQGRRHVPEEWWRYKEDWWKNNYTQFAFGSRATSRRFQDALAFYRQVKRLNPNTNVIMVGHSLGGAIAQFVAEAVGTDAMAINPATSPFVARKKMPQYVERVLGPDAQKVRVKELAATPRTYFFANKGDPVSSISRFPTARGDTRRHIILNPDRQGIDSHDWQNMLRDGDVPPGIDTFASMHKERMSNTPQPVFKDILPLGKRVLDQGAFIPMSSLVEREKKRRRTSESERNEELEKDPNEEVGEN